MREMVACIHPVGVHAAEIVNLQFDEGLGEFGWVAQFDGEFICKGVDSILDVIAITGRTEVEEGEQRGTDQLGTQIFC